MIDSKGKLFGKINIIDLLIATVLIIAVCAAVFKFGFSRYAGIDGMVPTPPINVEYVMKVSKVRDFTAESIKKGDKIYNEDNNTELGVITDVQIENAVDYVSMADGTIQMATDPNRYDVYVTAQCNAHIKRGTYYADITEDKPNVKGTELCENAYVKVYSTRFSSMAQIIDVNQK